MQQTHLCLNSGTTKTGREGSAFTVGALTWSDHAAEVGLFRSSVSARPHNLETFVSSEQSCTFCTEVMLADSENTKSSDSRYEQQPQPTKRRAKRLSSREGVLKPTVQKPADPHRQ